MKLCGLSSPRVSLGRACAVQGRATSTKLPTKSWGPQTSNQALTTTVLRTQRDATRHGEQSSGSSFGPHATLRRGHIRWARVRAPPYRALQVFSSLCSARRSGGQSQAGHACPCCDLILDSSVPPLSLSAFACAIRLPCLQDRTILYPLLFSSFPTPCLGHTHTPSQEDYD
jgi:hypothetical protein